VNTRAVVPGGRRRSGWFLELDRRRAAIGPTEPPAGQPARAPEEAARPPAEQTVPSEVEIATWFG
jgi:hypothetical protein